MRRVLWTSTLVVAGIALYTLAGFFLAPGLIDRRLEAAVSAENGRRLDIERVAVNPFTFELSLFNVTLIRPKNKALVSAARVHAFLDVASLVQRDWLFRDDVELFDVEFAAHPEGVETLAVSRIDATGVVLHGATHSVSIERAQLKNADMRFARDRAGRVDVPSWLGALFDARDENAFEFGTITAADARVVFTDRAVTPTVRLDGEPIDARLTQHRRDGEAVLMATLQGRLADSGTGDLDVEWRPGDPAGAAELRIDLRTIDAVGWSPYVSRALGYPVEGGDADLSFALRRADGHVGLEWRLVTNDLRIGAAVNRASAGELPVPLAVALLQDASGRIDLASRQSRRMASGETLDVPYLVAQGLRDAVTETAAEPFATLAALSGRTGEDLDRLEFSPGRADLMPATAERIDALGTALQRRPLLGLTLRPGYDPVADRNALAREQVRLHVVLATSTRPPVEGDETPLDLNDAKVRDVLDEFAASRLSGETRAALDNLARKDEGYYRGVFDALVENQAVAEPALRRLARYRVQSVVGRFEALGIDKARLTTSDDMEIRAADRETVAVSLDVRALR